MIIAITRMKKMPKACIECDFYESGAVLCDRTAYPEQCTLSQIYFGREDQWVNDARPNWCKLRVTELNDEKQRLKRMGKVVLIEVSPDGLVNGLKKDELQKMLDDAYNAGYTEGRNTVYFPTTTITCPNGNWWDNWKITCDSITNSATNQIDKSYMMPAGLNNEADDTYIPKHSASGKQDT